MEDLFTKGIAEFNRQYFFEASRLVGMGGIVDVRKPPSEETTGEHRIFYQGLIQTAVGFYHLSNENYKGACSQFGKALSKLEQYLPSFHGINTQFLVEDVRVCLADAEHLRSGGAGKFSAGGGSAFGGDESRIPQIVVD